MKVELRPWKMEDLSTLVKLANNIKISRTMRDHFPFPYTREAGIDWISFNLSIHPPLHYAIVVNSLLAGGAGLIPKTDVNRKSVEIGYWLGESFWGKGIATIAVKQLTDYILSNLDVVRITAEVFSNNPASMKVLEKSGYFLEGIQQQAVFKHNELLDAHLWVKLRE
jgi:ribosomal-protein-alanine N-acetyltransferase